jgi:hypothetical protein
MASQNPRRHLSAWPHCALVPKSPTPTPSVMPKLPASPAPGMAIPEDDWHLMFDAVKSRLSAAFSQPDTAAATVSECVEALAWLQAQLPRGGLSR